MNLLQEGERILSQLESVYQSLVINSGRLMVSELYMS